MVEYSQTLDATFRALSDATRRDMLMRLAKKDHTISALAKHYPLTFAGVAKHIGVLEEARLVEKQKRGREQVISYVNETTTLADMHLRAYAQIWSDRFDRLEKVLTESSHT